MVISSCYCDRCATPINPPDSQWNSVIIQGSALKGTGKAHENYDLCTSCVTYVRAACRGTMGDVR